MTKFTILLLFVLVLMGCKPQPSQLKLPAIISSHMVLQQSKQVALWGKARPGSTVTIQSSWGEKGEMEVAADSSWLLKLQTVKSLDPQLLTIVNDDSTLVLTDVLLGEVWLCSGQSNMEMPLAGWPPTDTINNSKAEIAAANYPSIHLFTVARNFSSEKLADVSGSWKPCTPQTAALFSGSAFFFGKRLHKELNVPIGLISSSWGGTPAESWISGDALLTDSDFKAIVEKLKGAASQEKAYKLWLESHTQINVTPTAAGKDLIIGQPFFDDMCASACDDATWEPFIIPGNFESTSMGTFDGVVWFRKTISIPASWKGSDLELHLGTIDDRDVTYFNGVRVGGHEEDGQWQTERKYHIPASLVKPGDNLISFRVIDTQGGGGVNGLPKDIYLKSKKGQIIPLAGVWKHRVVAEYRNSIFYMFNPTTNNFPKRPKVDVKLGAGTPSMLFNAMIAPLSNYTLKGTIWYQGESNVGRAKQYSRIFPMLIESWRKEFGNEQMPFYYVQIAPWPYEGIDSTSSAALRDAQRRTLSTSNTGMAVILDVDNQKTIHPGNKQDVGNRLAAWALVKDYGKDVVCSGPLYKSLTIEQNKARIAFDYVAGGLVLTTAIPSGFEIAASDNHFYPASAHIDGNTIIVSSPNVANPVVVRYAYKNGAKASLFNKEGFPAASFVTSPEILE